MYGTYVGMKLLSQRSGLKDSESTKSVCGRLADSQTNVVLVQNEGVLGTVIQHLLVLKASWAVDCVHQIFAVAAQKCDLDYRTNLIRFRVLSSSYKRRAPICMYIYIYRERGLDRNTYIGGVYIYICVYIEVAILLVFIFTCITYIYIYTRMDLYAFLSYFFMGSIQIA